ncbi:hypothetical protein [Micromonospora yangpuensis]|uniref:Mannose-6-phosphate isomerase, cupin superfamily n=1 Tax=Micromonospora yangpuensis TaxID=683228 RepID=A0A1C6UWS3_9ACTN|nr:hypothetical protein [Micromonospora yangpuensis]GGM25066.1 hypothetical protein GCM10012279_49350 [Micromonospora yangpuensis]SCL58497.1 hypothetical protein GA0070617_3835 [Micromonospora yangpuensis]
MTAGTVVHTPDHTEVVLGEIGQRVLLVNTRVRVWEVALAPGESQPWHLHHNPYVVLCLDTSACRMDWLDGSPSRHLQEEVGGAIYRPVSPVHMLTNQGDSPYRNRIIELLDLGEEASGEPFTPGDPTPLPGTTPEVPALITALDTEEVRVRRFTVPPASAQVWRAGAVPVVLVNLAGGTDTDSRDGVHYLCPGETHTIRNTGDIPFDAQVVELRHLGTEHAAG